MMDETGLWRLFFATGLPEAYLAVRGKREEAETRMYTLTKTAFQPGKTLIQKI